MIAKIALGIVSYIILAGVFLCLFLSNRNYRYRDFD
jgi:hypothetical protein